MTTIARSKWLPRVVILIGAVYGSMMLLWYNNLLASLIPVSQTSNSRTFRPKFGEMEVIPVTRRPLPAAKKKQLSRLILSPQERAAVRKGELATSAKLTGNADQQNEIQPNETANLKVEVETHTKTVKNYPRGETRKRSLRCVGWKATGDCRPNGPRLPNHDHSCSTRVLAGVSGYCEVEDTESSEKFRVGRRFCNSIKPEAVFRCSDATNFANFPALANEALNKALQPGFTLPNVGESTSDPRDGIVMVIYPKLMASAFAAIRVLRDLGCKLPMEIWFVPREMRNHPADMKILHELAADDMLSISFREVTDFAATGFRVKVFSIYHSHFDRVLFLDADNVPVRDPTFLFELQEFQETGAVFWPDFWHPTNSIFNIHSQSLIWELLDIPFANMFEQESGQLLVDRRRHGSRLELVRHYAFQRSDIFDRMKLVHGDKDLFRLAWLKQLTPFHMIRHPPAVAGKVVNGSFCGMTMVQHDTEGNVLFLHRNSNKLTGVTRNGDSANMAEAVRRVTAKLASKNPLGRQTPKFNEVQDELKLIEATLEKTQEAEESDGFPDPVIWTHLLSFKNTSRRAKYVIETYNSISGFSKDQNCYGQHELGGNADFYMQKFEDLSFSGLETDLRRYAMEAADRRQQILKNP
ncbi:hypothetical protein F444_02048 [Phytophthora nicotianae P1976]|uniref:Nucleotide-diphospho-sugar transferase domain-containing protein n=1 Tax=Phytophthora nicotianae P1976 TaxID=1317066 RepID=A0A081AYQ2_PHYNI|nr:hypothetical protein F444_02048 [Phytophthora nicotianae P1976]